MSPASRAVSGRRVGLGEIGPVPPARVAESPLSRSIPSRPVYKRFTEGATEGNAGERTTVFFQA